MDPSLHFTIAMVAVAYLCGSIPFGLIIARLRGVDVRAVGSGNIGATNVTRALGKKIGAVVLLLDAAKGALPVWGAIALASAQAILPVGVVLTALFAVAGHCFPVWLKFKGGKGVATSLGVFLVLDPIATGVAVAVFVVVFLLTRVAAAGSLVASLAFVVAFYFAGQPLLDVGLALIVVVIIFVRHIDNLRRLIDGTENKME